jgi:lipopolysaccharide export system protein LptA
MRFTIERIRTMVLAAGVLLVLALAGFLVADKWKSALSKRDLPTRLGANVQQEGRGVTYTEAHGGHMLYKIHASRAEQLKNGHALLHNVQIEFFSKDGSVDSISGNDFEYDHKSGVGTAQGPVDITLTRPTGTAPKHGGNFPNAPEGAGTVQVKTSGLVFNQNSGVLMTTNKVDFSMMNGKGSAVGAKYDSQQGYMVLDQAVELTTDRGGRKVVLHALHAEIERDAQTVRLTGAQAQFKTGEANAGLATILFRKDGSAQRLDATNEFTLATTGGGKVNAPMGTLDFGEHNEPKSGHLQGGVKLSAVSPGRHLKGSAPQAQLEFSPAGELSRLKLRDGAEIDSETQSGAGAQTLRESRTWRSPLTEVDFRAGAKGGIEPAQLRGSGGVVVTSKAQRGNAPPVLGRMAADEVRGEFAPGAELTTVDGKGHATMEQTLADGARQTASGDRIEARFAPFGEKQDKPVSSQDEATEIQSAVLEGHVLMVQQPVKKAGTQAQPELRATAGRATYEDGGQRLELTENPRVEDGGLNLTANAIEVSQQAGEAFARGDVKATWLEDSPQAGSHHAAGSYAAGTAGLAFGGQTPAHVVADEARFHQKSGEAVFRGHARLWQDANSITAPLIQLNRTKQTLVARSQARSEPVVAVLLGTGEAAAEMVPGQVSQHKKRAESRTSRVVRVRGGEFVYADVEHQAVMTSGAFGEVTAEAGGATCRAQKVTLLLRPRGTGHDTSGVERVTADGNVLVSSAGRKGAGAKLVYSSMTGEYALTGTPAEPPRLTDPSRGTVTGAALIFNSRNDSVSIEGRGHETRTETTAPR